MAHDPSASPCPACRFQLWVNLPKALKMCKPRYQDITAGEIPVVDDDGASGAAPACLAHPPPPSARLVLSAPATLQGCRAPALARNDAVQGPSPPPLTLSVLPTCLLPAVRVMGGMRGNVTGPIQMRSPGALMDVRLAPGAEFRQVQCGLGRGLGCVAGGASPSAALRV